MYIRRILLLVLIATLVLSLTACGGKKTVDITDISLSENKDMLAITYVAKGKIAAGEGAFRVNVSSSAGSVYCMSELDEDLDKNSQNILLFPIHPVIGQKEWKVSKTIQLAGGTKVTDTITTDDILKLFGDSAVISVEFQLNGKTIVEKTLDE